MGMFGSGTMDGPSTPWADEIPLGRLPEWTLRGISQVVFQNNVLTGIVMLVAFFFNSPVYGVMAIVGTAVATMTAMALKADRGLIKAGLFGFNGCLFAIGLSAYLSTNFTKGDWPNWQVWVLIIVGSAFTTIIFAAISNMVGPKKIPALTGPFVIAAWLFIFGVYQFDAIRVLIQGHPVAGQFLAPGVLPGYENIHAVNYTAKTWYEGIGYGIAEIWFQDNWISGYILLVAIAINSRISGLMALLGAVLSIGTAMVLGADESTIHSGLFSFNAILTALALGGFFFVLNWQGLLYTIFGTVVTTVVWASIHVFLTPIGMPTFTSAFIIVAWFFIMAKGLLPGVVAVAPADATDPEDNLRRWLASRRASNLAQ
jgi:urea transporter